MKVKVWNKNVHPYQEKFRDDMIVIPAGGFVYMEEDQAHDFKCSFGQGPRKLPDGTPDPTSFKMIAIEKIGPSQQPTVATVSKTVCMVCQKDCGTEKGLLDHSLEHASLKASSEKNARHSLKNEPLLDLKT